MRFKGDLVIADLWVILGEDENCDKFNETNDMSGFGVENCIVIEAEWNNPKGSNWGLIYNLDLKEEICQLLTESEFVGIFLLEDVLKINPGFEYENNEDVFFVKTFEGKISAEIHDEISVDDGEEFTSLVIIGSGTLNFIIYPDF